MESHDIWIYGLIPASFITVFGLKKIQHKEHIEKKIKVTAICLFLTLSLIDSICISWLVYLYLILLHQLY